MMFYHGTYKELAHLEQNSYVTKNFKDACKFGYRRAILSNSPFVYIYTIDVPEELLTRDQNRDRAYLTLEQIKVELKSRYLTYQTPYKLTKFKRIKNNMKENETISTKIEEWKKRSENCDVCGIFGCEDIPTIHCPHCGNWYCKEHSRVHFH